MLGLRVGASEKCKIIKKTEEGSVGENRIKSNMQGLLRSMGSMVEAAQRSVAIALHEPFLAYQQKDGTECRDKLLLIALESGLN